MSSFEDGGIIFDFAHETFVILQLPSNLFPQIIMSLPSKIRLQFNPIPTEGGPFGPEQPKTVWHFHSFMVESPNFMTLFISVPVWSQ